MTHDEETKKLETALAKLVEEVFNFMVYFNSRLLIKEAINNDANFMVAVV